AAGMGDPFRLAGKVAAVIGAGSGIGEAVALGCGRLGARVACLDLETAKAEAVARRIGESAEAASVDIRNSHAVHTAFDAIRGRQGRLDIVVCTPSINV